jgi:RNA polymerase sigma factor (sigma-70 family)
MDEPMSTKRTSERVSAEELARLQRMIEVYATKSRIKWELPIEAEAELQECGRDGLTQALARFDSSRASLPTYAEHRIRGAIKTGAKAMHRARRQAALLAPMQHKLRDSDSGDKWDAYVDLFEEVAIGSLAALAYESSAVRELGETAEDRLIRKQDWQQLHDALATLPERSEHALRRLFFDEASGDDLADEIGIDKSNITRLKKKALSELIARLSDPDGT